MKLSEENGSIMKLEKSDARDYKIVSVDPIPEKAIDIARRLRVKFVKDQGTALDNYGIYDNIIDILDAYEQAYNENKGE